MKQFAFSLESEMWHINHQRCGLIFGPAAAILQIAHPRVAQGVADHSNFSSDSLGRLQRTLQHTNRIAFGTLAEAQAMQARLRSVHGRVNGSVSAGMQGRKGYSAFEPDLLLWVLATMIEAAINGFEQIFGELERDRKESFYQDMRDFGEYFGLAPNYGPPDYANFCEYYQDMISGDLLGSHPLSVELAQKIALPDDSRKAKRVGKAIYFLTVETLPATVRERLGFHSTVGTRLGIGCLNKGLPVIFSRLPDRIRLYPESRDRLKIERTQQ